MSLPDASPSPTPIKDFIHTYRTGCTSFGIEPDGAVLRRILAAFAQEKTDTKGATEATTRSDREDAPLRPLLHVDLSRLAAGIGGGYDSGSGIRALAPAMARLPMNSLDVHDTYLGDDGLYALCQALAHNSCSGTHGMATLAHSMDGALHRQAPPLRGTDSVASLVWLRTLNLSSVGIRSAACLVTPSLLLTACPQLQSLDLSWNRLGSSPAAFALLCGGIQAHTGLLRVNLAGNYLGSSTCVQRSTSRASASVLHADGKWRATASREVAQRALRDVDGITTALSELIAFTGRPGASLLSLDLSDNQLGSSFMLSFCTSDGHAEGQYRELICHQHPFVNALFYNNKLEKLNLTGNGFPDYVLELLDAKLRVNRQTKAEVAGAMNPFSA